MWEGGVRRNNENDPINANNFAPLRQRPADANRIFSNFTSNSYIIVHFKRKTNGFALAFELFGRYFHTGSGFLVIILRLLRFRSPNRS